MINTWKEIFCRQLSTAKYWKKKFGDEFDRTKFLERSDAVYICKKAQADIYEEIISNIDGRVDAEIVDEIKQLLITHWENDDSALGMHITK